MLLRIDGIDVRIGAAIAGQQLDQAPRLQILLNIPLGTQQDAVSVQGPVNGDTSVIRCTASDSDDKISAAFGNGVFYDLSTP